MNSATQPIWLNGPAGALEGLCDEPEGTPIKGTAVICHPHPLFGGTMQNKVVQTLAKHLFKMVGAPSDSISEVLAVVLGFMTKGVAR